MSFRDTLRGVLMPGPKAGILDKGVALYGDSIMANGIGAQLRIGGFPVSDYSQAGDTAANAWRRFAYDTRTMSTVVLGLGSNDLTTGVNPVPYLERMAQRALDEGREVIFTGITQRELPSAYSWLKANEAIRDMAFKLNCKHARWQNVEYSSQDRLHPDQAMAAHLANTLIAILEK